MRFRFELSALTACSAFYVVFIARSGFSFEGRTYFALHDDAMISMRYARNLADGHGLTWSGNQHVEGYTNFLWTLWMAFVHLLGLPSPKTSLAMMITGAVALAATMLVVRALCRRLEPGRPALAKAAMLLTGLFYPLVYWSLRGMEVSLAALLIALMALLALRVQDAVGGRAPWLLAAVMAAAVLTRDDLLLPSLVVTAFAVWVAERAVRRRLLAILGGTLLAVVAAHVAFRLAYYGDALPNTYYLKLGGIPLFDRLKRGGLALAYTWLVALYAPLLLACAYLVSRRRSLPRGAVLLVGIVVVQSAYSLYVGGDAWEGVGFANRYITSAAPLLIVLAVLGIGELSSVRGRRLAPWLAGAFLAAAVVVAHDWLPVERLRLPTYGGVHKAPIVVALIGAVSVLVLTRWRTAALACTAALAVVVALQVDLEPVRNWARYNAAGLDLDKYWARAGVILREDTAPRTTIAVIGAGNTPYFAERPAVDLLGKMDPVIAHEPPKGAFWPGHNKWDYAHSIGQLHPDVVTLLWAATPADLCQIEAWGYRHLKREVFVREGAPGVNGADAARRISALADNKPWFTLPRHCPPAP